MKVLLLGGGRMGQRHLAGIMEDASSVILVEPKHEAQEICINIVSAYPNVELRCFNSLSDLPASTGCDLAILAGPASGRLDQFKELLALGIKQFLIEKPLEQSRVKVREFAIAAKEKGAKVWSNHYRRSLSGYAELIALNEPLNITITSGAIGLGCNGIHWIDFALYLTGQTSGKLLFGEIDELPIGSGRGAQFRDYGGRGLFSFPDGSRLYLSSSALSSAPTALSVVAKNQHWMVDQNTGKSIVQRQLKSLNHPTYLYGKDYSSDVIDDLETADFVKHTKKFISELKKKNDPGFPTLETVLPGYEMLFDLLECSGADEFQFT